MQHKKTSVATKNLLQHRERICCNNEKNYYNISITTEKTPVATKKSTATSRENLVQQRKKQNKTSQELLCNIRETPVATNKKKYRCNIPHHLLQH